DIEHHEGAPLCVVGGDDRHVQFLGDELVGACLRPCCRPFTQWFGQAADVVVSAQAQRQVGVALGGVLQLVGQHAVLAETDGAVERESPGHAESDHTQRERVLDPFAQAVLPHYSASCAIRYPIRCTVWISGWSKGRSIACRSLYMCERSASPSGRSSAHSSVSRSSRLTTDGDSSISRRSSLMPAGLISTRRPARCTCSVDRF